MVVSGGPRPTSAPAIRRWRHSSRHRFHDEAGRAALVEKRLGALDRPGTIDVVLLDDGVNQLVGGLRTCQGFQDRTPSPSSAAFRSVQTGLDEPNLARLLVDLSVVVAP